MKQGKVGINKIEIPEDQLAEFSRKWNVAELALFGSVLRDDFRSDSDVDVLVRFKPNARRGLFVLAAMQEELAGIFGRKTHLATRGSIETSRNEIRRKAILESARVVYVS